MIAAIVPLCGAGHTFPVLNFVTDGAGKATQASILLANLNTIIFDYISRQKVQTNHFSSYILEQIPVIPPEQFEQLKFGPKTAAEIIRAAVLELTYTAHDMAPFARDMGYVDASGEVKQPFIWNTDPFFAIDFATVIALAILPLLNKIICHSSPAISHARNPALRLSKTITWFRNDSSDRRYSILYVEKKCQNTLFDAIAKDILKLSYEGEINEPKNTIEFQQAQSYWNENKFVLEDVQEIGRWLHHFSKAAGQDAPSALHGTDYRNLIDNQMSAKELFFRNILLSPNFNVISKAKLWKWWQQHMLGESAGQKRFFNIGLEEFCNEHPEVSLGHKNTKANRLAVRV